MKKTKNGSLRKVAVDGADRVYFAGANTAKGFISFYPEIFNERELKRLYVIKGGPGSGKSTLLRKLVLAAKDAGLLTEAYLCGSDPLSLDAAVIRGPRGTVAAIDATSPHAYDAKYPGAVASVFDAGAFWDVSALRSHREAIATLADAKSEAYRRAYRYLAALGVVRRELRLLGEDAFEKEKARAACRRYALTLARNAAGGSVRKRSLCTRCVSMRGEALTDAEPGYETVTVSDHASSAPAFFDILRRELEAAGIGVCPIVDTIEPEITAGLVIPSNRLKIVAAEDAFGEAEKNFNMTRFLRRDKLAETKSRRSFARKCAETLKDGALRALADAGECHFALEDIFVAAMDFEALTKASEALIAEAVSLAKENVQ